MLQLAPTDGATKNTNVQQQLKHMFCSSTAKHKSDRVFTKNSVIECNSALSEIILSQEFDANLKSRTLCVAFSHTRASLILRLSVPGQKSTLDAIA